VWSEPRLHGTAIVHAHTSDQPIWLGAATGSVIEWGKVSPETTNPRTTAYAWGGAVETCFPLTSRDPAIEQKEGAARNGAGVERALLIGEGSRALADRTNG
jgi:hypothetical protein